MGLFSFIKEIKNEVNKSKQYISMNLDELKELDDDDLLEAIQTRINNEESRLEVYGCLEEFKDAKRVFYIINYFDMEVQNGGLCQFFVNSSREVAPYLLESLDIIGAYAYKNLLLNFVYNNNIDLNDLSSFIITRIKQYEEQLKRYPFDDFDDAYYEMYEDHPLDELLLKYVKENLKDFV